MEQRVNRWLSRWLLRYWRWQNRHGYLVSVGEGD